MNYAQALAYLNNVHEQGSKLSLQSIQEFINHSTELVSGIKFIQVAGTNGKGSTCHFITSILKAAGYKTGLFISPHLQDIRERITVNKTWVSKKDFCICLEKIKHLAEIHYENKIIDSYPTFFEHLLLMALYYFKIKQVDFAVLEVGLGGRLDATSAVTPLANVITTISFDHTKTLGSTLGEIALEKAGIIKPGVPIICGCQKNSIAEKNIRQVAMDKQAPYYRSKESAGQVQFSVQGKYLHGHYQTEHNLYEFKIIHNGRHQIDNAITAIRTIEVINQHYQLQIQTAAIKKGLKCNFVPGRIEKILLNPPIILDGGHNEASIHVLSDFLKDQKKEKLTLIFGVLRDKQYKRMIRLLLPYIDHVIITEPISRRALAAEKLAALFEKKNTTIVYDYQKALELAKQKGKEIVITGSLYLIGEMRNIIYGGKQWMKQI